MRRQILLVTFVCLLPPITLAQTPNTFVPTGSMSTARAEHTATLLPNAKVLIAGGSASTTSQATAELYDPSTAQFTFAGNMNTPRGRHTATLLADGKVLIAGGDSGATLGSTSAELYDPSSGTFILTGSMVTGRSGHTATLLPNGKVLIAGGFTSSGTAAVAELYDPATGAFTATGTMNVLRFWHTATLLPNGKVLIAGGANQATAELYDQDTGTFTLLANTMSVPRSLHTATLLPNGKVLIVGGDQNLCCTGNSLSTAELFDPATNTFSPTGGMTMGRFQHTATLLLNGQILVAGGDDGVNVFNTAEIYDPATDLFSPTGSMSAARDRHTATLLPNGGVLVAGGANGITFLASAEVYNPALALPAITSISHTLGTQGETISNFAVDGNNFQAASILSFSGTGISVNSYSLRTMNLIVASITIANNAIPGPQDVTVINGSQQSPPAGPFTVLQIPSGQLILTTRDSQVAALLTPTLASTSCINTDGVSNPIRGHTGQAKLVARVRTAKGTPAVSVTVTFQVRGANPTSTTVVTDKSGRAPFSYVGANKGLDTITASTTVGNATLVSNTAYIEWGRVTIAFRMPLPKDPMPRWRVTTRVNDPSDIFHQCNGYYSLDLVDKTPGSEPPVLVPLGGAVRTVSLDPMASTFGTFGIIDHGSSFETIYAHLNTGTVQIQEGSSSPLGQVVAAMDSTGVETGVHLHYQARYSGTSGNNNNLRIFIEQRKIEEYCVNGQPDINNQSCSEGSYPSSNNGLPFGSVENPQPNSIVGPVAQVSGWALDDGSISMIKILIDGSPAGTAVYGAARPDICNGIGSLFTWSGFLGCPNVGFNGQVDTTTLTNTFHVLTVSAIDNDGAGRTIATIPILISNP
jgi:murein DD-endopeptidase MepM/ murein hydrolase activator NlpD